MDFPLIGGSAGDGLLDVKDDFELLIQATFNEKCAPEVLAFQTDLLERLQDMVTKQEEHVESLEQDMEQELQRMALSLELKRIRYLIKLYYRTRLRKIERYAADYESIAPRLSKAELQYAEEYRRVVTQHLEKQVTGLLPEDFQMLDKMSSVSTTNDLIPKPPLDSHVFCKLLTDVGEVYLDENHSVRDMEAGQLYMIRYRPIAHLIANNSAHLV